MMRTLCWILTVLFAASVSGRVVFVSPAGDDGGPGTAAQPYRTIQSAVDTLTPGDTCFLRGGTYRESVVLRRSGTDGQLVRIRAYPGEVVTLDGTERVEGTWTRDPDGVFHTRTDLRFEQLFAGMRMLQEARWPNCPLDRVLSREGWATAGPESEYQKLRDPELGETGIDWNGALAILNVAHQFWSWSREVRGYVPGSDLLPYTITMNPFHYENRNWWHDDYYYLVGKRAALDAEGEWHLSSDGILSLLPPGGANPSALGLRAKQRDYGFTGEGLRFVEVSGIHFFGCTFRLTDCEGCVVEHCALLYPSYARGVPDAEEKGARQPCPGTLVSGSGNTIRSCAFEHCPNYGVVVSGQRSRVENCLVRDVNWTGTLRYTALALRGMKGVPRPANVAVGNTLYNVGNTILGCSGPDSIVEYNHVHHGGLISSDVSLFYTSMPSADGVEFRYNWVHDSLSTNHSLGIRGDDKTRGLRVHHNVVWNIARDGIITKGGRNRVYNNTCFANGASDIHFNAGPERDKWWQKHVKAYQNQNEDSLLVNNCGKAIVATRRPIPMALPGDHSHNYTKGDPRFVDRDGFDFRPRADSPLVDAGRAVDGITAPYVGDAPDIGAYEYGGAHWLPGHRNGVWVTRTGTVASVCLSMPILESVRMGVLGDRDTELGVLVFSPSDWFVPQALPAGVGVRVMFRTEAWGDALVRDVAALGGTVDGRARFERPDLSSARHVDSRPKFDYENGYASTPTARPVYRAYVSATAPAVDGALSDGEWPGWDRTREMVLASLSGVPGSESATAGRAYALQHGGSLYLAVELNAEGQEFPMEGGTWGPRGTGGVEFDFAVFSRRRLGPVAVLHGYPSGMVESVTDAGASEADAARLREMIDYAAHVRPDKTWTCELRVPLNVLGADVSDIGHVRFNVGARCNGVDGGPWFAAVKTGGANYDLLQGAELRLEPLVSATRENMLVKSGFEDEDLSPWRLSTNHRAPVPEGTVSRVEEGLGGGWCVRLQSSDPEMMKERVFKWTFPFEDLSISPGEYCLSYLVRVAGKKLVPRSSVGSFNGYVHVRRNGEAGGNLGQRETMLVSTGDRWIRQEASVSIPEGVVPAMISLQLHQATGEVLIDDVCLLPCDGPGER